MTNGGETLLSVEEVVAGYGPVTVLRGVSLRLDAGECVGLFGPNGHGKTTLMDVISGLLRPRSGRIRFEGEDITRALPSSIVARGLVHCPQANTLFPDMAVGETLEFAAYTARARARKAEQLQRVYTLFPRLGERRGQLARTLSGGERQMLSLGCGLMCAPRCLMLDEPTLGLAPRLREELEAAISQLVAEGMPLVLVEQDIEFLVSLADRLYLVDHGEVAREIDRENAPDHQEIMTLYFGEAAG